jgi:uncharacterized protein YndB with AHSA1/START domain
VTEFDTSVRIARPPEEVFSLIADPLRYPLWNSAVTEVRALAGEPGQVGSTYVMHRDLPGGPVDNDLEIVARAQPAEFVIRTTSGPTPFVYRYRFEPEGDGTRLDLHGEVELAGPASLLGPIAGRAIKRGVDANLASLKAILE